MDFNTFYGEIGQRIREAVAKEQLGEVSGHMIEKNGENLHGILYKGKEDTVGMVIYVERMYQAYLKGATLEAMTAEYVREVKEHKKMLTHLNEEGIMEAKPENIIPILLPKDHPGLRSNTAVIPFENLVVALEWRIPGTEMVVWLSEEQLKWQNVDKKKLLDEVCQSASFKEQIEIIPMLKASGIFEESPDKEMYMIQNKEGRFGGAGILNQEVMDSIAEKFGGKAYILPGSLYECIDLNPWICDLESTKKMLLDINQEKDRSKDIFLSKEIYSYDCCTKKLQIADAQKEKELRLPEHKESKQR